MPVKKLIFSKAATFTGFFLWILTANSRKPVFFNLVLVTASESMK